MHTHTRWLITYQRDHRSCNLPTNGELSPARSTRLSQVVNVSCSTGRIHPEYNSMTWASQNLFQETRILTCYKQVEVLKILCRGLLAKRAQHMQKQTTFSSSIIECSIIELPAHKRMYLLKPNFEENRFRYEQDDISWEACNMTQIGCASAEAKEVRGKLHTEITRSKLRNKE